MASKSEKPTLLTLPRELRNRVLAYYLATPQDNLSTMFLTNHQLAAEYVKETIFHHHRRLPHLSADMHARFPDLHFDLRIPETDAAWSEITTLTLFLPVSVANITHPATLTVFLREVLRMPLLPFVDTLKIDLQPVQPMTNKWHTPVDMVFTLGQHIVDRFVDSDAHTRRESVGRVIVSWQKGLDGRARWEGLLTSGLRMAAHQSAWFEVGDWDKDGEVGVLWRRT